MNCSRLQELIQLDDELGTGEFLHKHTPRERLHQLDRRAWLMGMVEQASQQMNESDEAKGLGEVRLVDED
jgi:hypothetical protein